MLKPSDTANQLIFFPLAPVYCVTTCAPRCSILMGKIPLLLGATFPPVLCSPGIEIRKLKTAFYLSHHQRCNSPLPAAPCHRQPRGVYLGKQNDRRTILPREPETAIITRDNTVGFCIECFPSGTQ